MGGGSPRRGCGWRGVELRGDEDVHVGRPHEEVNLQSRGVCGAPARAALKGCPTCNRSYVGQGFSPASDGHACCRASEIHLCHDCWNAGLGGGVASDLYRPSSMTSLLSAGTEVPAPQLRRWAVGSIHPRQPHCTPAIGCALEPGVHGACPRLRTALGGYVDLHEGTGPARRIIRRAQPRRRRCRLPDCGGLARRVVECQPPCVILRRRCCDSSVHRGV